MRVWGQGSFERNKPPPDSIDNSSPQGQLQFQTTMSAGAPPGRPTLTFNAYVVVDILAAMHAMPSWKACQIEGTSWTGTAEENILRNIFLFLESNS